MSAHDRSRWGLRHLGRDGQGPGRRRESRAWRPLSGGATQSQKTPHLTFPRPRGEEQRQALRKPFVTFVVSPRKTRRRHRLAARGLIGSSIEHVLQPVEADQGNLDRRHGDWPIPKHRGAKVLNSDQPGPEARRAARPGPGTRHRYVHQGQVSPGPRADLPEFRNGSDSARSIRAAKLPVARPKVPTQIRTFPTMTKSPLRSLDSWACLAATNANRATPPHLSKLRGRPSPHSWELR
jgi:hypothetical protein